MENGKSRFMVDLISVVSNLAQDVDMTKLNHRVEELLGNYKIERLSILEAADDLPEKIEMFLSAKTLEGLSEKTIRDYGLELILFAAQCKLPVAQINTAHIRNYLASLEGVMSSTVGKKLSVLKSFFGWLNSEEFILRNPTAKIKLPKKPKRLPKSLTIEELEIVRESCQTLRQRALIEVFYSTACRLSEIAGIKLSHVDMQSMSIKVIGKGDAERIVYLSYKAMYHLKKYLDSRTDDCEYLFVTLRRPIRKMHIHSISDEIDKVEKVSKLNKKLTPHVMRHTFAQLSTDAGIELADLQQLMGHSNPSTTLTYARVSEERKSQAHKKFHMQ